jgi:ParB-like chromosome segregation protein Spo0J
MRRALHPAFPLARLEANDRNPRTITAAARARLRSSLERHGDVGVLVARELDSGGVRLLSGHQRVSVMREMGWTVAPVYVVTCTDADERELLVRLNGHDGAWDMEALAELVDELEADGVALEGLGLDTLALDGLLADLAGDGDATPPASTPEAPPEREPEADEPPSSAPAKEREPIPGTEFRYVLTFDNEEQQALWHRAIADMREAYPELPTVGMRVEAWLGSLGFVL